jgi:hypothetical protein
VIGDRGADRSATDHHRTHMAPHLWYPPLCQTAHATGTV